MPVNYTAEDAHGNEATFDENHLLSQMKSAGHDVQGTTPDGRSLIMGEPDAKGNVVQYQVPIEKAMEGLGYRVKSAVPKDSTPAINSNWGAMLQSLPDDPEVRRHFLADKLAKQGLDNSNIIGIGNTWHAFDPQTAKWHQVTEDPGWNVTGAKSAALAVPHMLGATVGGIAGAGLGAVPGALAGTAVGGAAGEALRQGGLSLADDDYRHAVEGNLGASAVNVAKTGGIDAAAHGIARGVGAFVPKSVAALPGQVLGKGMAYLGSGVKSAARAVADSPLATGLASGFNPLTSSASIAADALEAPAIAAKMGVQGAKSLGTSKLGRSILGPQLGDAISEGAEKLGAKRAPTGWAAKTMGKVEEAGEAMGGAKASAENAAPNARDILGNWVARSRAAGVVDANPELAHAMAEETAAGQRMAAQYGITGEDARAIGAGQGRDYREGLLSEEAKKYAGNWGDKVGGFIHGAGQAGKGANAVINTATKAGLRGVQGLGSGLEKAGVGVHAVSTLGAPVAVQQGAGQGIRLGESELEKKLRDYYRRLTTKS